MLPQQRRCDDAMDNADEQKRKNHDNEEHAWAIQMLSVTVAGALQTSGANGARGFDQTRDAPSSKSFRQGLGASQVAPPGDHPGHRHVLA
jgi:hypothetical protein